MCSWLVLFTLPLLLLSGLCTIRAAGVDVIPREATVPQCAMLKILWSQAPPIHLHVKLGDSITNLVDLGLRNNMSTTFEVALPIGQIFRFALNTITDQLTIFQSGVMEVRPGNTDCLDEQENDTGPSANLITLSTSAAGLVPSIVSTATESTSASESANPRPSEPTDIPKRSFPVGAVVGSVFAFLGMALALGLAIFWKGRRRSVIPLVNFPSTHSPALVVDGQPEPNTLQNLEEQPPAYQG
ncbi:hypothetical protein DFH09DRAFT_1128365 [Mycena vulgaris]|nr:hypothetical protein DFH09DRAFT_1128365 [Mycena vulgaris]